MCNTTDYQDRQMSGRIPNLAHFQDNVSYYTEQMSQIRLLNGNPMPKHLQRNRQTDRPSQQAQLTVTSQTEPGGGNNITYGKVYYKSNALSQRGYKHEYTRNDVKQTERKSGLSPNQFGFAETLVEIEQTADAIAIRLIGKRPRGRFIHGRMQGGRRPYLITNNDISSAFWNISNTFGYIFCSDNSYINSTRAKQVGINQSELDSTHVSLGSTEPSANKQTDPLTLANDTLTQEDQTNTENADFTEMLCANLTDSSLENHESATPNTNEPDLQTPITRNSRNVTGHARECKPNFEVLGKPTKPEFPSNHPDVEQPAECPCTYDKLKVMRRTLRNAEYVLEDVMLHLKRTRKLEKIVSDLLNSMDRTLRVLIDCEVYSGHQISKYPGITIRHIPKKLSPSMILKMHPRSDASDLQSTIMHHTEDFVVRARGRKRDLSEIARHPSEDLEEEMTPKYRCTYKESGALINAKKHTLYVLEDAALNFNRTKIIHKSVDRKLRGTHLQTVFSIGHSSEFQINSGKSIIRYRFEKCRPNGAIEWSHLNRPKTVKKNTQKDQAMPENVVAVVGSSANSSAHSPEQTASSTPDSNGDDLQTSSTPNSREQIQHAGRWWPDVDVILECPCDDSDAEPQTKCPCSYGKLRALINSVRNAEYVLEEVMLHLKRTRKLEKIVSTVLNSVARKLRATHLPM
ncbi:hypothetical protein CLF_104125 [Clonorchis sinensis]|uniref:Uncharacterized protein n=1 Tax=Clonorchis sinensis TaxID=79923 RepID=G7YB14_CLOSI|nr:hypothetical protein CLF_104125 [Clonorchis sinensis]